MAEKQTATLFAPDINCGHCQQHITNDLGKYPGIGKVSASPQTKIVEVEYDPDQVSLESIKSVLWAAGYPAKEVTGDTPSAAITL
ncbi:MAG: heavy-metal-associated domain-containing protein [Thermomicrobiales bacterium]